MSIRNVVVCLALAVGAAPAAAQDVSIEVVAVTGQQAPGTPAGALFAVPDAPVLNDAGWVAFRGDLQVGPGGVTATTDTGIWLRHPDGTLSLLARAGDPAPGAPGGTGYSRLDDPPRLNAQGRVAFAGSYLEGTSRIGAVYGPSGATALTLLAGASAAWGSPPGLPGALFAQFVRPALNGADEVVFAASLVSGVGGVTSLDDMTVWGTLGGGPLALLHREGELAPGTGGDVWSSFSGVRLNDAGQIAFMGLLRGPTVTGSNAQGLWASGAGGAPTLLARTGTPPPPPGAAPGETLSVISLPSLAADGGVSFGGSLNLAPPGSGIAHALFAPDGAGGSTLLARQGQQAPGLPEGALFASVPPPALDDAGDVAFAAALAVDGVVVTPESSGVLYGPGAAGPLTPLLQTGGVAPDLQPDHRFLGFDRVAISPGGDIALEARLRTDSGGVTASNDEVLYVIPRGGAARLLLREGQPVELAPGDVRTLQSVELFAGDHRDQVVSSSRRVALRAVFTGGATAVLVVSLAAEVPAGAAPAAVALTALLLSFGLARLARR